ncbi:phenylalanine--tRNA ligase subunit beta [Congregibacter litoralis]|uniref:Phenylalanine--tRNA ligase beta subunit n=1 Tax=Congregibacter litoralis KT71 TaxID=314285 RepID=A4AAZ0_9GAMM|nr:phenylalanine--tRNA ligase subunit beta [Congregibacter litoralis]EAQ96862.1 phenylalanyl-tRNA synthetase beta subunit [Congregibacter litoralis KT71]
MKFSEQWLREWVNPALSTEALGHQITMAGLEVDAIEPVAGAFSGVIVAEITEAVQHPDADKLQVCTVDAGNGSPLQIVCGAPNARKGLKTPLAVVGAMLPGDFAIKAAKLRGVESQGMLCAASELGLSEEKDGILELPGDAPVGTDLREYLKLDDVSIEIGLTPNRSDCLGMAGIAREVGLLNDLAVCAPPENAQELTSDEAVTVDLRASARCPRYLCRVIDGVDLSRPSPLWMQEKLRRCGVRSIDAAVDVTNYLLLEFGQPMHAFDLDKIKGGIVVREANPGETLKLLNDQTITLGSNNLVIADHEGPLAFAGIMGGADSAVGEGTTRLLLESAFFAPVPLSGQARAFGLHTDSSHRFERGVDFELQRRAMERATELLLEIVGGAAGPITEAVSEQDLPAPAPIHLRAARIERLLGVIIESETVERILRGVGLEVSAVEDGWECAVPSWRFDLRIEADLLEELARVYGYNNLPVTRIRADVVLPAIPEEKLHLQQLRRALVARDYFEAICYSFVDADIQKALDPAIEPVALNNPISPEHAVMRSSLLAGLLRTAQHNVKRQQPRVRLFETGLRFVPGSEGLTQRPGLAMLVCGSQAAEGWADPGRNADFYDLKGDVEALLALTGDAASFRFEAGERSGLHPGQTAWLKRGDETVGFVGVLHPTLQKKLDFDLPVVVAELDLEMLRAAAIPAFTPVSRYPALRRDIAVIVDKTVKAGELLANVRATAGAYLQDLTLFDVYEGKGIDPARKSVALGLTFQDHSRTLDDNEVNTCIQQVVDSLKENYQAELRG